MANWLFSSIWQKKFWQINRSANRLLIVSINLDGFSLVNHRQFAKLFPTKLSRYTVQIFRAPMFNEWNERTKLNASCVLKILCGKVTRKMFITSKRFWKLSRIKGKQCQNNYGPSFTHNRQKSKALLKSIGGNFKSIRGTSNIHNCSHMQCSGLPYKG